MQIKVPEKALRVLEALESRGHEAYVVGGCVRDALLGREPNDWDICTSALPQQVKEAMAQEGFATFDTGIQHGTVTVHIDHEPFEVTTFRADGSYSDGRRPDSVTFLTSVEGDLLRRDFTVNAMAYNPQRGLVDISAGQDDLAAGVLRCVGDPVTRFEEDGLRIMRALRFAATFGFVIDDETSRALHQCRDLLNHVAMERISVELLKLLCGRGATQILLDYRDVIAQIMPEAQATFDFQQHTPYHVYDVWEHCVRACEYAPDNPILKLAALIHDFGKPQCFFRDERGVGHFYGHPREGESIARVICRRLKLSNNQTDRVCTLVRWHDRALLKSTPKSMRRLIFTVGPDICPELFNLVEADMRAHSPLEMEKNLQNLEETRKLYVETLEQMEALSLRDLSIGGADLMNLGIERGPELGRILNALLELVVDGDLPNQREALLKKAQSL